MDTRGNPSNLWIPCKESQLNINWMHSTCLAQAQLYVTPKIGYVNAMLLFHKRHLALNSPLGHFNGDNANSPTRRTKLHGDSKVQSLTRPTTHAAISTFSTSHNSISSQYSQSTSPRVLQHQKQILIISKYVSKYS